VEPTEARSPNLRRVADSGRGAKELCYTRFSSPSLDEPINQQLSLNFK